MEVTRLIERCRQGDADALGELYKAYAQKMRGVCRRYVSDEQALDDVLHDAFVIIFTSFDRLRDSRKAESWMMSITRNVASKYKDHQKGLSFVPLEEVEPFSLRQASLRADQTAAETTTVRGVPLEEVMRLVDNLPEGYGKVFRLSVFEGMSHKEIADMLGIEPHSSSSQLARAKRILRKMMQQYWAAVLLLLLMPLTYLLLKKDETALPTHDKPEMAKQEESEDEHSSFPIESVEVQRQEPVKAIIAQAADSTTIVVAQERVMTDTIANDTAKTLREVEIPHYDMAESFPDLPTISTNDEGKWSLELAYAGPFDELNRNNQPFSFKPTPSAAASLPGPSPSPIIPSSIDNWTDYATYLANHPDAVSAQTRSVIMRIALNNASGPGEDKILRKSHHQMPVTWSLALKYRLNHRFGLESGLSYSRLSSDFEMGTNGNTIGEQQTIHYLGIPMKGIYNMYSRQRWGVYGSLGMTTEIPVHATLHSDFFVNGLYEASDKTTIRAPWQFSATFGLGLQYHLTPSIGFFAEPSMQYFIPMKSDIETYRTEHPFTFSLPVGIRFTW